MLSSKTTKTTFFLLNTLFFAVHPCFAENICGGSQLTGGSDPVALVWTGGAHQASSQLMSLDACEKKIFSQSLPTLKAPTDLSRTAEIPQMSKVFGCVSTHQCAVKAALNIAYKSVLKPSGIPQEILTNIACIETMMGTVSDSGNGGVGPMQIQADAHPYLDRSRLKTDPVYNAMVGAVFISQQVIEIIQHDPHAYRQMKSKDVRDRAQFATRVYQIYNGGNENLQTFSGIYVGNEKARACLKILQDCPD